MAQARALLLAAMMAVVLTLPYGASTYDSGGIQASESQVAMIPATGLNVGDSVTFYLTLTNTQQTEANNVGYAFYKNQYTANNPYFQDVIDIAAEDYEVVSVFWDGLLEDDDKLWISLEYPLNSGNQ